MTTIVHDTSEALCLCAEYNLYLKPIAKMTISVALPQLKLPGKSISNWEVMERVKSMVVPDQFSTLRISKSTMDFIRFEGEVENKGVVKGLLSRLDGKTIKLSGFTDVLKVRAVENKMDFPTRHDWDSFFRDAKNMNETLPGERPDTIHLEGLPCRWFSQKDSQHPDRPSEEVLAIVFQSFGKVRNVDIPMLDPYQEEMMEKNFSTFSFGGHLNFDAYVQYQEYGGFNKAMDTLRGMKLMLKGEDGKAVACNIKVTFDTSKHLSEVALKRRSQERLKLQELERQREEQKRKEKEEEERRKEEERKQKELEEEEKERKREERLRKREQKLREREERRNLKKVKRQQEEEQKRLQMKIAMEERRLLLAQRNLESIRLIAELLARAKAAKQEQLERERMEREEQERKEQARQREELARLRELETCRRKQEEELRRVEREKERALELQRREKELRDKLLGNLLKKGSTDTAQPPPGALTLLPGGPGSLTASTHGVLAPLNREKEPPPSGIAEKTKGAGGKEERKGRRDDQQASRTGDGRRSREGRRGGAPSGRGHTGEGERERGRASGERNGSQSHSRRRRSRSHGSRRRNPSHHRRSRSHHNDRRRSHSRQRHSSRSSSRHRSRSSSLRSRSWGRSHGRGRSYRHSRHRDSQSSSRSRDRRSHSHDNRKYRHHSPTSRSYSRRH